MLWAFLSLVPEHWGLRQCLSSVAELWGLRQCLSSVAELWGLRQCVSPFHQSFVPELCGLPQSLPLRSSVASPRGVCEPTGSQENTRRVHTVALLVVVFGLSPSCTFVISARGYPYRAARMSPHHSFLHMFHLRPIMHLFQVEVSIHRCRLRTTAHPCSRARVSPADVASVPPSGGHSQSPGPTQLDETLGARESASTNQMQPHKTLGYFRSREVRDVNKLQR